MAMKFFGKKRPPGLHRDEGFPVMSDTAYRAVLDGIETARKPQWYLEIGSRSGGSLRHRKCNFIAIDPEFAPGADVLSRVSRMHFFQMTSDAFFEADFIRRNDLKVDFAFIDGMHLFEYALRDFMNCEANAMPSGVIALHDVCPFNHAMTTRDLGYLAASAAWTGDVWKVMVILQKYRPDLRIDLLSASKTEIFFRLRLFNALPYLFSALRIAASMAVIGAVVGEWVGANVGIGAMIIQATFNFDSALLYSAIVMSASLSGAFFLLVTLAERWVIRWHPEDVH